MWLARMLRILEYKVKASFNSRLGFRTFTHRQLLSQTVSTVVYAELGDQILVHRLEQDNTSQLKRTRRQ